MCQRISTHDVALSLSRLTGKGYENSLMDLNRIDKPSAFDSLGNFNVRGFGRFARSEGISDAGITGAVSKLADKSFANSLMELNMFPFKPFK